MYRAALLAFFVVVRTVDVVRGESDYSASSCTPLRMKQSSGYSYDMDASDGPTHWGSTCRRGRRQSPVNIVPVSFTPLRNSSGPAIHTFPSVLSYTPSTHNFKFRCVASYGACGTLRYGGTRYKLAQVHLHSPSEHHITSRRYPLELHFVHVAADGTGRVAVAAVFFVVGRRNPALQALLDAALAEAHVVAPLDRLQTAADGDVCVTQGSLTTPPCDEAVTWVFGLRTLEASLAQVGRFREMVGERPNARPLQPLNGRNVRCFERNPTDAGIPGVIRTSSDVEFIV